jgi:hypothetical protein
VPSISVGRVGIKAAVRHRRVVMGSAATGNCARQLLRRAQLSIWSGCHRAEPLLLGVGGTMPSSSSVMIGVPPCPAGGPAEPSQPWWR